MSVPRGSFLRDPSCPWWLSALLEPRRTRRHIAMDCVISHHTFGTVESGVDRGRTLTALDMELMSICQPLRTAKCDFTQTPSVDLGTNVFWTAPQFDSITGSNGPRRKAL